MSYNLRSSTNSMRRERASQEQVYIEDVPVPPAVHYGNGKGKNIAEVDDEDEVFSESDSDTAMDIDNVENYAYATNPTGPQQLQSSAYLRSIQHLKQGFYLEEDQVIWEFGLINDHTFDENAQRAEFEWDACVPVVADTRRNKNAQINQPAADIKRRGKTLRRRYLKLCELEAAGELVLNSDGLLINFREGFKRGHGRVNENMFRHFLTCAESETWELLRLDNIELVAPELLYHGYSLGINWEAVAAKYFPGRSSRFLMQHASAISENRKGEREVSAVPIERFSGRPGGAWTPEEEILLITRYLEIKGRSRKNKFWEEIAKHTLFQAHNQKLEELHENVSEREFNETLQAAFEFVTERNTMAATGTRQVMPQVNSGAPLLSAHVPSARASTSSGPGFAPQPQLQFVPSSALAPRPQPVPSSHVQSTRTPPVSAGGYAIWQLLN
ncbi:hypothetical protein ACMFMF_010153 [Clarireedia jacksonii]